MGRPSNDLLQEAVALELWEVKDVPVGVGRPPARRENSALAHLFDEKINQLPLDLAFLVLAARLRHGG